jgi:aminopeptidase
MLPDFSARLNEMADVIVQVGLNLQPGQRIVVAEPYELQGVARSAEVIVAAVQSAAERVGAPSMPLDVIWGDPARLRAWVDEANWTEHMRLVARNAERMDAAMEAGDALLFLQGSHPRLFDGLPAARVVDAHARAWEHFGPVAQQLTAGATNWTIAPAPSPGWASAAFEYLPVGKRLTKLWNTVFTAFRCSAGMERDSALARWKVHLANLEARREALNAARHRRVHLRGDGTDLTAGLPPQHRWCTAQMQTRSGRPFVANLPTEEIFTAPEPSSVNGTLRVSRPVFYGGGLIAGIDLRFDGGEVVAASAQRGADLLEHVLNVDDGARRLGEIAMVETPPAWAAASQESFRHVLLDENASPHVALGEGYPSCAGDGTVLNRSRLHLDLPVAAEVVLA